MDKELVNRMDSIFNKISYKSMLIRRTCKISLLGMSGIIASADGFKLEDRYGTIELELDHDVSCLKLIFSILLKRTEGCLKLYYKSEISEEYSEVKRYSLGVANSNVIVKYLKLLKPSRYFLIHFEDLSEEFILDYLEIIKISQFEYYIRKDVIIQRIEAGTHRDQRNDSKESFFEDNCIAEKALAVSPNIEGYFDTALDGDIGVTEPILIITHDAGKGGASLIALRTAKTLCQIFNKKVYTLLIKGGTLEEEFKKYSLVCCLNQGSFSELDNPEHIESIIKYLYQSGVNKAICNTVASGNILPILAKYNFECISLVHELPTVISALGLNENAVSIANCAQKVVFPCEYVRNEFIKRYPINVDRISIRPQGIYPNIYSNDKKLAKEDLLKKLGLNDDSRIVLGCGRGEIRKGTDLFVQVAQKTIAAMGDSIHFVWLGDIDASLEEWIKLDINQIGLEQNVHLLAFDDEPEKYFAGADIFLMISREDPYPTVVLEAMDAGTPVVSFEGSGGAVEQLEGGCGVLVPYLDLQAMAENIRLLLNNEKLYSTMAENAQTRIGERFQYTQYVESLLNTFNNHFICFTLPAGFALGGTEVWSIRMYNELIKNGINPILMRHLRNIQSEGYKESLLRDDIAYSTVDLDGWNLEVNTPQVYKWYESFLPATILPNWCEETYKASSMLYKKYPDKVRIISFLHSDQDTYYKLAVQNEKCIAKFICVSDEIHTKLLDILPHRAKDISTKIYPVIMGSENRTYPSEDNPLRLCYAGRILIPQKRSDNLYLLVKELEKQKVSYRLSIIGSGDYLEELRKKITTLGSLVAGKVRFIPPLMPEEMCAYWEKVDVFVNVSEFEGTSISMLEAMGSGAVPVVTNVSGVNKFIQNNANGFLIDIGDMKSMAEKIKTLDDDRKRLVIFGRASMDKVGESCSMDSYIDWFTKLETDIWAQRNRIMHNVENAYFIEPGVIRIVGWAFLENDLEQVDIEVDGIESECFSVSRIEREDLSNGYSKYKPACHGGFFIDIRVNHFVKQLTLSFTDSGTGRTIFHTINMIELLKKRHITKSKLSVKMSKYEKMTIYRTYFKAVFEEKQGIGRALNRAVFEKQNCLVKKNNIAVILHLYYTDLWDEIESYLHNISEFDLYISLSEGAQDEIIKKIKAAYPDVRLFVYENKGRDIGPFIEIYSMIYSLKYEFICKIHTKKSIGNSFGNRWRVDLMSAILGSREIVDGLKGYFENRKDIGLIAPAASLTPAFIGKNTFYEILNKKHLYRLAEKAAIKIQDMNFIYPSGSIFWFRPEALKKLLELNLSIHDFLPEHGQADGELEHAIERFLAVAVKESGYSCIDTAEI